MPWGDNTKGPWGSGGGSTPPEQPDFDEVLKKGREKFDNIFGGGNNSGGTSKKSIILIAIIAIIMWMATGVYTVDNEEQGVVLRFGAFNRISGSGIHYHLPSPIEKVYKVAVTVTRRVEVGVRSGVSRSRRGKGSKRSIKILEESLMLTGDENIVDIDFEVQWEIKDAAKFLFKVVDPAGTVKGVAESAMREVIGRTPITNALTEGRSEIEQETSKIMQAILDEYETGISITRIQLREAQPPAAVIDSFRDVQNAKTDKESAINQAEAYRNDIIPRARGEAEKLIQESQAYKQEVIALSEGEASRFSAVYNKYKDAKEVTRKRIYIETMEKVLKGTEKVLIDNKAQGSGVIPYLPLPELGRKKR